MGPSGFGLVTLTAALSYLTTLKPVSPIPRNPSELSGREDKEKERDQDAPSLYTEIGDYMTYLNNPDNPNHPNNPNNGLFYTDPITNTIWDIISFSDDDDDEGSENEGEGSESQSLLNKGDSSRHRDISTLNTPLNTTGGGDVDTLGSLTGSLSAALVEQVHNMSEILSTTLDPYPSPPTQAQDHPSGPDYLPLLQTAEVGDTGLNSTDKKEATYSINSKSRRSRLSLSLSIQSPGSNDNNSNDLQEGLLSGATETAELRGSGVHISGDSNIGQDKSGPIVTARPRKGYIPPSILIRTNENVNVNSNEQVQVGLDSNINGTKLREYKGVDQLSLYQGQKGQQGHPSEESGAGPSQSGLTLTGHGPSVVQHDDVSADVQNTPTHALVQVESLLGDDENENSHEDSEGIVLPSLAETLLSSDDDEA